jgi:uncharacterized protein YbjT (DUF2867 family)
MNEIGWILGSTGLTGTELCSLIETQHSFHHDIYAPVRNVTNRFKKVTECVVKFDSHDSLDALPAPNWVCCCLGTTIKKAGSQAAFLSVDFELVVNLAQLAYKKGAQQFILVSSIGADKESSNFYLRTKGQTEEAVKKIGFESLYILRPAGLKGNRKEERLGERFGIAVSEFIKPLLVGNLRKYRSIDARDVAKVMLHYTQHSQSGFHIFESDEIQSKADSL